VQSHDLVARGAGQDVNLEGKPGGMGYDREH
jgi:hypothetical protein